jgi:hypothetical protein
VERRFLYRKSCVHISARTLFRDPHYFQAYVWIATHELIHVPVIALLTDHAVIRRYMVDIDAFESVVK